nr:unnamed protein product [Callosobruchus chinensis]
MSKRSSNDDLGKEDRVIKRQRRKEEFDKLQSKMQRLQREIKLFSSEGSSAPVVTSEEPKEGPTDILHLFGADPASGNPEGVMLCDWMVSRLDNIVKTGINHEEKQKIIGKYPPAANCSALVPPILNEEIAGALTDSKVKENRYLQKLQTQISAGLMALRVYQPILLFILEGHPNNEKFLENLADSLRLTADLFHNIYKYLYGENLLEKVKQARATKTASSQVGIVKRENPTQQNKQGTTRGKARNFPEFDKIEVFRDSVPPESVQEILAQASHAGEQEISAVEFSSSRTSSPYPGCGTFIRMAFVKKNVPEEGIPILLASVSEKTMKEYNVVLRRWWEFCMKNAIKPLEYNLSEKLYPLEELSLEKLSHKLVMLMALTSAHRLQTFSLIKIQNISVKSKQVEIRIPDKIKTSGKSKSQPISHFPFFIEKPQLCVASTICHYLEVTKTLRSPSENRLILTIKKSHRAASSQSLSRWLKNILTTCGIDTNIFKGHSPGHAATSAAARAGLNIEIIRETAGWTKNSEVFNKFYHKPLAKDDSTFAKAVLSYQNNS